MATRREPLSNRIRRGWKRFVDLPIFDGINPRLTPYSKGGGLYDPIHAGDLRATHELAEKFGFPHPKDERPFSAQENLVRTAAGTDAIHKAFLAHRLEKGITEVIYSHPTFFTVPGHIREKDMTPVGVHVKEDLSIDVDGIIEKIREHERAAVYVALPENPTGKLLTDKEWKKIIDSLGEHNTGIFDCVGFNPNKETQLDLPVELIKYAREKGKRVMVLGSISKLGGTLSDVRAGYLASNKVDLTKVGTVHLSRRGSEWLQQLFEKQPKLARETKAFYRRLKSVTKLGYELTSDGTNFTCVIVPKNISFDKVKKALAAAKVSVGTHEMYKDYHGVPFVRIAAVRPSIAKKFVKALAKAHRASGLLKK